MKSQTLFCLRSGRFKFHWPMPGCRHQGHQINKKIVHNNTYLFLLVQKHSWLFWNFSWVSIKKIFYFEIWTQIAWFLSFEAFINTNLSLTYNCWLSDCTALFRGVGYILKNLENILVYVCMLKVLPTPHSYYNCSSLT